MQVKTIKFKSGELIACGVDDRLTTENLHDYDLITIKDPVVFSSFKFLNQYSQVVETIGLAPFIATSNDTEYLIPSDSILTISNLRPGALDRYNNYLDLLHAEQSGALDQPESRSDMVTEEEIWDAIDEAANAKLH